jgi:hypothetical protein
MAAAIIAKIIFFIVFTFLLINTDFRFAGAKVRRIFYSNKKALFSGIVTKK